MIHLNYDLTTGAVRLAQSAVLKTGSAVPCRLTFSAAPGEVSAIQLALGTDASAPEVLAYTEDWTAQNATTWTATLDCNDARLLAWMSGKGPVAALAELAVEIDGARQVSPNLAVTLQPAILAGPESSEGGPVYLTEAQIAAGYAPISGAFPEAPEDGSPYARQDAGWVPTVTYSTLTGVGMPGSDVPLALVIHDLTFKGTYEESGIGLSAEYPGGLENYASICTASPIVTTWGMFSPAYFFVNEFGSCLPNVFIGLAGLGGELPWGVVSSNPFGSAVGFLGSDGSSDVPFSGLIGEYISATGLGGYSGDGALQPPEPLGGITLTPGDWDVFGQVILSTDAEVFFDPATYSPSGYFVATGASHTLMPARVLIAETTTVNLSVFATSAGSGQYSITARRVR